MSNKRPAEMELCNGEETNKRMTLVKAESQSPADAQPARLVDLTGILDLFADPAAASRARVTGLFKNWSGADEYAEAEVKVIEVLQDQAAGIVLSAEMLLATLPELRKFDQATLDGLLEQFSRHMRYEEAAAQLVADATAAVLHQAGGDTKRIQDLMQARCDQAMIAARAKVKRVQDEAAEQAGQLKEKIQHLEKSLKAAQERDVAKTHELERAISSLREAQKETDLKRETSLKLKAEVIENDKLTLATLSRIKMLETNLSEARSEIRRLEDTNAAVRASGRPEQVEALQDMLQEREAMVFELTKRLESSKSSTAKMGGKRETSLLDRLGISMPASRVMD